MLVNPADKNDVTMRFRRAPQGIIARIFDWIGVISLATSISSLLVYFITDILDTEGIALRFCLTSLNIAIVAFVAARLVELADRMLRMSSRDRQ
jgi:hypothetical protein